MTKLHEELLEFHALIGQETRETPGVPKHDTVRLRGRLVIEEAFEFLEALVHPDRVGYLEFLKDEAKLWISESEIEVRMTEAADALADVDYVVEGSRLALGIDGEPIARAVHAANMKKANGPVDSHGKRGKPPGWRPPDIAAELVKQGWLK